VLPLGHAALAYLCFVGVAAVTDRTLPARRDLAPLLFASQLPDLIDKPLAFVGVLASGRSLAHSLVALVVFLVVVGPACRRTARAVKSMRLRSLLTAAPLPLAVGYVSHLVGDIYRPMLNGTFQETLFLFWPLARVPAAPADSVAPWTRLVTAYTTGGINHNAALVAAAVGLFVLVRIHSYWRRRSSSTRSR